MLNSYGHFIFLLFLVFNNIFKYQLLRAFDHICMEKARYKFLIIIIIIVLDIQPWCFCWATTRMPVPVIICMSRLHYYVVFAQSTYHAITFNHHTSDSL